MFHIAVLQIVSILYLVIVMALEHGISAPLSDSRFFNIMPFAVAALFVVSVEAWKFFNSPSLEARAHLATAALFWIVFPIAALLDAWSFTGPFMVYVRLAFWLGAIITTLLSLWGEELFVVLYFIFAAAVQFGTWHYAIGGKTFSEQAHAAIIGLFVSLFLFLAGLFGRPERSALEYDS